MYLIEEETRIAKLRLLAGLSYKNLVEFIEEIKLLSESEHLDFLFSDLNLKEVMLNIKSTPENNVLKESETILYLLYQFYNLSIFDQVKDFDIEQVAEKTKINQNSLELFSC